MVTKVRTLIKRLAAGYVVIATCILMSYIPMYSIPVLVATSLGTGVLMVVGTAFSLVVERPLGKILVPLFYPERSRSLSMDVMAAGLGA